MKKPRGLKKRAYSVDEEHKLLYIERPPEEIQLIIDQFKDELLVILDDRIEEKIDEEKYSADNQVLRQENEELRKSRDFWRGLALDLLIFILGSILTIVFAILLRK